MGSRLGMGITKALLEVEKKPLIIRHLELLKNEKDIRVVVGYQAEKVIEVVKSYRQDVKFVFNHNYRETKTGDSVVLGAQNAGEYVLALDGDILIHPGDMDKLLSYKGEFVSGSPSNTEDSWMIQIYKEGDSEYVKSFSKNVGNYEWNGITQVKSSKIQNRSGYVFQLVEPYLPLPFLPIRTWEIDTMGDYKNAVKWVKSGFKNMY